jgi:uncharacterized linocin/CFP29 family protein
MNHLLRSLAPISDAGWELLDGEAKARVTPALAVRKLVDFAGPHGWQYSATNLGRTTPLGTSPGEGVSAQQRRVLPLVELRADFELARAELRDADRGAADTDLAALDTAARQIAVAENVAVFGDITDASPHEPVPLGEPETYPSQVAGAVEQLLAGGIAGPYGLALGRDAYRTVIGTAEHGGYPLSEHLSRIIEGPLAYAPGVNGAVLVSLRGGDFLFESGQDISIGYEHHDELVVRLYLQESFSFRVATPEAAVALGG